MFNRKRDKPIVFKAGSYPHQLVGIGFTGPYREWEMNEDEMIEWLRKCCKSRGRITITTFINGDEVKVVGL